MPELPSYTPAVDKKRPFRTAERHELCLNGHSLERVGVNCGFDHSYWLSDVSCNLCRELRLPRATWDEVDHLRLGAEAPPTHAKLRLDTDRPPVPAGVGQIVAKLNGDPIADIDIRMCQVDRRGVIEHVRVDPGYLRRGLGTVLVTAALARRPDYRWSTTAVNKDVAARAFWASLRLAVPLEIGAPFYCSHMRAADGEPV